MSKSMSKSTKITLTLAAVALMGLGAVVTQLPGEQKAVTVAGGAGSPKLGAAVPDKLKALLQAATPAGAAPAEEGGAEDEEYADNPIGDVLRDILEEDKHLSVFMYYYEHVLLDEKGRRQYEALLSDAFVLSETREDLLYPPEKKEELRGNIKRLMKIDYLEAALEWTENPEREAVLSTVEDIILTDNFPTGMGMDMRISLSGNKMELYALLQTYAPERAAAVVETAKGTRVEPLVGFISESIRLRRQKEQQLRAEASL